MSGSAEWDDIIDAMCNFALTELGTRPELPGGGLQKAWGTDIPEQWPGQKPAFLFYPEPGAENATTPQGAHYGQYHEYHQIEGALILGLRSEGSPAILPKTYKWVRPVFDAFHLHETLGGLVNHLEPKGHQFDPNWMWGEKKLWVVTFQWEAKCTIRSPRGQ